MTVELPAGYQPSADEEFIKPKQVEFFRRRLEESRVDLQQELEAIAPSEAQGIRQEETRLTKPVQRQSENLPSRTASGSSG